MLTTVLFSVAAFLSFVLSGKAFTDGSNYNYSIVASTEEELEIYSEQPDIVSVEDHFLENGRIYLVLQGHQKGTANVVINDKTTGEPLVFLTYAVGVFNILFNQSNGNFSNYLIFELILSFYLLSLSVIMWAAYVRFYRQNRYSYHVIFTSGFAIWMTVMSALLFFYTFSGDSIFSILSGLQRSGWSFMFVSIPVVLIFATALIISNISLIRHEGLKKNNMFGILISFLLIGGEAFCFAFGFYFSGSEFEYHLNNIATSTITSVYVLFECFLLGSVISLARAAKYEPDADVDYIIILGCAIRKDGTLFPLIKGRVDRAIALYKKQLQATGKKAVFVPSGGRGRNEVISEGEAMKRYLIEQGISEEQIMPETESTNTAENMRFSRRLIEERSKNAKVVFSTTNYHVFRSGVISRQAGFEPDGIGAPTKWYFWPNASIREIIGMVVYMKKVLLVLLIILIVLFALVELLTF